MNVNEAHDLLVQHEQDLAAELDPDIRTWYRLESELQPDIILARRTLAEVNAVAGLIGHIASAQESNTETDSDGGLSPGEVEELAQPEILSPEELLNKRIERKYASCLKTYQSEVDAISATKKSKQEFQLKMARRSFARQFNDFSDVTGQEHIVFRADLLKMAADSVIDDESLREEVFSNSADYAKRHALDVTSNPANFGELIANSVEDRPHSKQFEGILKGIFSTEKPNLAPLYSNLANAAFEVLSDQAAAAKLARIVHLDEPYVPINLIVEAGRNYEKLAVEADMIKFINDYEAAAVLRTVIHDVTGVGGKGNARLRELTKYESEYDEPPYEFLEAMEQHYPWLKELGDLIDEMESVKGSGLMYDPVKISDFSGQNSVYLGLKPISEELHQVFDNSPMFLRRMQELAPYSYGAKAAKKILGSPGVHGLLVPLSPSLTVDIYFSDRENRLMPSQEDIDEITERASDIYPQILIQAIEAQNQGVRPYQAGGQLKLLYENLFDDGRSGIILYRPSVPMDTKKHHPMQQLLINYAAIRGLEYLNDGIDMDLESAAEQHRQENEELRESIAAEQKRFLGRRPVRFAMSAELRQMAGLISVSLRYDPKVNEVISRFELDDGVVELNLDRSLKIKLETEKISMSHPGMQEYYENLILKLAKGWMCHQEVHTSEGTVSEKGGISANMGHYAYLRVREDGRRYQFSETQRVACLEEQAKDLAVENERLMQLDPAGTMRNSTYVRENFDPSQPPLEVYLSDLS